MQRRAWINEGKSGRNSKKCSSSCVSIFSIISNKPSQYRKNRNAVFMVGNQCFLHYCGDFSAVTIQLLLPQPCLSFTVIDVELTASLCSQAGEAHAAPRFIFIQVWKWCISAPGKPSNCLWPQLVGHDPETAYCVYWDEQQRRSTFNSLMAVYDFNADFDDPFIAFLKGLYSCFFVLLFFQGRSNHKINIWVTMNVHRSEISKTNEPL